LKVIIIEDSALASLLVEKVIKQIPTITEVNKFSNGKDFVKWVESNKSGHIPDLIISDINMPILDGIGVLKYVNSNPYLENTKVIVVSANKSKTVITECLRLGADNFIIKPFNPDKLKEKLKIYLENLQREEDKIKSLTISIVREVFNKKYNNLKFADDYYQYKKIEKEIINEISESEQLDNLIKQLSKTKRKEL